MELALDHNRTHSPYRFQMDDRHSYTLGTDRYYIRIDLRTPCLH